MPLAYDAAVVKGKLFSDWEVCSRTPTGQRNTAYLLSGLLVMGYIHGFWFVSATGDGGHLNQPVTRAGGPGGVNQRQGPDDV